MEAAARVAARYANAPSYNEMLATEARAALRAAEAASRAALHAQAAAQSVLDGIEAAHGPRPVLEPVHGPVHDAGPKRRFESAVNLRPAPVAAPPSVDEFRLSDEFFDWQPDPHPVLREAPDPRIVHPGAAASPAPVASGQSVSVRWDAELQLRPVEPVKTRACRGQDVFSTGEEGWWRPAAAEPDQPELGLIELAEPELVEPQPIPGIVIEFPRELVAKRKARPRLAESPHPTAAMQLSIFEIDPVSLSADPAVESTPEPAQALTASAWTAPAWRGVELEPLPGHESAETLADPAPQTARVPALKSAPAVQRLLALVVDGTLVAGSLLAAAIMALSRARALPGLHAIEIGMGAAFLVAAALYEALFFTLGRATPGMKYAGIRLTTFEGHVPARAERYRRLAALLVSVLPAGLGLAWSLFDDDHLSWHDRLSRTYLCKG